MSDSKLIKVANKAGRKMGSLVKYVFQGKKLLEKMGIMNAKKFANKLSKQPIPRQILQGKYIEDFINKKYN